MRFIREVQKSTEFLNRHVVANESKSFSHKTPEGVPRAPYYDRESPLRKKEEPEKMIRREEITQMCKTSL
jgi:hypothetical protein